MRRRESEAKMKKSSSWLHTRCRTLLRITPNHFFMSAETTVVNVPSDGGSSAAGWIVALVVVLAVVIGGVWYFRSNGAATPAPADTSGATINVNLPGAGGGAPQE